MSSYFEIELDTTGPTLEIIAPIYAQIDTITNIRIISNEDLLEYQEIYFVDSKGIRHDLVFQYFTRGYEGNIQMNDFSSGIGVLYCRLKDNVGNISQQYSKAINIIKGEKLKLESYCEERKTLTKFRSMSTEIKCKSRKANMNTKVRKIISKAVTGGDYEN